MSKDDVSLDDELLLVTEKKKGVQKKSSKDKSSVRDDEEGEVSGSGEDSDHKGGKRKPNNNNKTSNKKPLKKRKTGDSSGESSEDEGYDDGWGDDLMGDDEDRAKLNAMPEFEREAILAERYTKRKELQDGWAFKKRLREEQRAKEKREGKSDNKRDLKETKENKDREKRDTRVVQKAQTSKNKALSELKKKRAKAGYKRSDSEDDDAEEGEVEEPKDDEDDDDYAPKSSSSDRREDSHAAEDDENEENVVMHYSQEQGHPLTYDEVETIRLGRELLEKWLDKPFFAKLIPGFFVRIGIGMDPATRMNVYRVAQVSAVVNKTAYLLNGKPTTKWLKLLIADKDKDFKMETISNRKFTESEYKHWKVHMERAGIALPTSVEIPSKLETLNAANNYRYTSEDIQKMLDDKKAAGTLPISVATEKARLMMKRDAETDPAEKERLDAEIAKLDELGKEKHSKRIVTQSVAKINQRNKDSNFKTTLESQSEVRNGNSDLDPFSRRRTVPTIVYASKHKAEDEQPEASTPPPTTPPPTQSQTNGNNNNNNKTNGTNNTTTPTNPLKVSAGLPLPKTSEHDSIDIDISSLLPSSATPSAHPLPPTLPSHAHSNVPPEKKPKSTLSLDDYMRRRNAMQ